MNYANRSCNHEKWEYVKGKAPNPIIKGDVGSVKAYGKWEEEDVKSKFIAIDSNFLRFVKAKQVLERLKSKKTGPVTKANLLERVATYKMFEGKDFRTHLIKFLDSVAQLVSMDTYRNSS